MNDLNYWSYDKGTYMVKVPFDFITLFKKLLGFDTKKEACSEEFLNDFMIYKKGFKGSPTYIQKEMDRKVFDSFLKKNKKKLKEKDVIINKI